MKTKVKWVLTRCATGAERRFNSYETAARFAERQCRKWGHDDVEVPKLTFTPPIETDQGWEMQDNYAEIRVRLTPACATYRTLFTIDCEVEI